MSAVAAIAAPAGNVTLGQKAAAASAAGDGVLAVSPGLRPVIDAARTGARPAASPCAARGGRIAAVVNATGAAAAAANNSGSPGTAGTAR
jgi:hypothetical protein